MIGPIGLWRGAVISINPQSTVPAKYRLAVEVGTPRA